MAKVYLVGMMGVGKSHWAGKLARRLNLPHLDLDEMIEKEQACSIADIFAHKGEPAFRAIESATLQKYSQSGDFVMATGGGAPCHLGNMDYMNSQGITIWLDEPLGIIIGRLKQGKEQRPLVARLADHELRAFIEQKLQDRIPFYMQARYRLTGPEISTASFERIMQENT
jgi:shikimate kinase